MIKLFISNRRLLATVAVVTGFILFAPDSWIKSLGIDVWLNQYRGIFSLVFLLSLSAFLLSFVGPISGYLKERRDRILERRERNEAIKYLDALSVTEKIFLRKWLASGDDVFRTGYPSKVHLYKLENLGIIHSLGSYSIKPVIDYSIADWAYIHLREHPELLTLQPQSDT